MTVFFFWLGLALVFYTYLGYGIVLFLLVALKRVTKGRQVIAANGYEPTITLIIAAFNERKFLDKKVNNCLELEYPTDKLTILFVTDGSTDGSEEYLLHWPRVKVIHKPGRAGKIAAMNHAMQVVDTELAIFCDADTMLNPEAMRNMVKHFANDRVACVAGEKRIMNSEAEAASGAGEGLYWKYESTLKRWDYELYSVVGAAGELFGIRTHLFKEVEPDTILDDFMISLRLAEDGYITAYAPDAYASEPPVNQLQHEIRRKIRISSGGIQSILRLTKLLNPFHNPILSFQYISHRVLRWTVTPITLFLLLPLNVWIVYQQQELGIYHLLLLGQVLFYSMAYLGWQAENRKLKVKALFVPFYFTMMNVTCLLGMRRYFGKQTTVLWEKADRG